MAERKTLAIIGAGGAVGRAATRIALENGHKVIAIDRKPVDLDHPSAISRTADLLSDDLGPVLDGADAVLSCIGLPLNPMTARHPPPLYTEGTLRLVKAMQDGGPRRLVVISASFAEKIDGPLWFRGVAKLALGEIFTQMREMERVLQATTDIDWTAVRPGWLLDEAESGEAVVTKSTIPAGFLRTRIPDLARFMVKIAVSDDCIRQTPAIATQEGAEHMMPHALMREIA